MPKNAIRLLLTGLVLFCSCTDLVGQEAATHSEMAAIHRGLQVLKEFESAFGQLTNPYLNDAKIREEATLRLHAGFSADARLVNDLVPGQPAGPKIAAKEYLRNASIHYGKTGLALDFEWQEAELQRSGNNYLIVFYGKKTILGKYRGRQSLHIENAPCRAGVSVKMDGQIVAAAQIRFLDTNINRKGKQTIFLARKTDPLQYITLPEVTDQLAGQIADSLGDGPTMIVSLDEITFNDLGISGEFSKQLTGMLQSSLTRKNVSVRNIAEGRSHPISQLLGSYVLSGNVLQIHLQLASARNRPIVHFHAGLPVANVPYGEIEPSEQLIIAALRMKAITGDQVGQPVAADGSLQVDLATNQGSGPQFYHEGDFMKVKVRANRPCMVRIIYQDAARNLVQLRNSDFSIPAEMTGQWMELPERFLCAAPFGFETLLAYATEQTFSPIVKKRSQDGFTFILDDLQKVAEQTLAQGNSGSVARSVIPITTYPRKPSR